jgi:hypothetical protein
MKQIEHLRVEERFLRFMSDLKSSRPDKRQGTIKRHDTNLKLVSAASRITLPSRFEPYIKIINRRNTLGFKFPDRTAITIEEVKFSDSQIIKKYSKRNFDYSRLNRDNLIKASLQASIEMGLHKDILKSTRPEDSYSRFPQTSSACFPTYQKKSNPNAQQLAIQFCNDFIANNDKESQIDMLLNQPATLFHRFQFKLKSNEIVTKIRPIWGIPYGVSLVESYFFRDWVDSLSKENKLYGKSFTPIGLNMQEISENIIAKFRIPLNGKLLSMDLKNFDSTIPTFMWALFYANLFENVDETNQSFKDHLHSLMFYHVQTPYCYFSPETKWQNCGTPSGCLITAAFNSWVNRVIFNYAHFERNIKAPGEDLCVLGDDNLYQIRYLSPAYIYNVYERFGLEINKEKTDIFGTREVISFLGYYWDLRNRATQKEEWYITHLALPSSFYTDVGMPLGLFMTYRAISVCLPLYNGYHMFKLLIGNEDKFFNILMAQYKSGKDTVIRYITQDKRYSDVTFPFSLFINGTWKDRSLASIGVVKL